MMTAPPASCSADVMKYGSGSVTKFGGAAGNIGEVSPNCSAISLPQAPAALTTNGASKTRSRSVATRKRSPACSSAIDARVRIDIGAERARRARDRGRCKARIGRAVALRPRRAAHIGPEIGKSAAHFVRAEQLDLQPARGPFPLVALKPRQFLRIERDIGVTARREFAPLADQFLDLLPLLHGAQRQRKFGRMTPFQPNIAEIDAARLTADRALLDHRNRVAALAQEIGRPGADQAAADDRNVVCGSCAWRCLPLRPRNVHHRAGDVTDIRADILIFGTGNFAGRIALDLAATASEPVTVAIAGRNRERLDWLRTAGNARAALFGRPARFIVA